MCSLKYCLSQQAKNIFLKNHMLLAHLTALGQTDPGFMSVLEILGKEKV